MSNLDIITLLGLIGASYWDFKEHAVQCSYFAVLGILTVLESVSSSFSYNFYITHIAAALIAALMLGIFEYFFHLGMADVLVGAFICYDLSFNGLWAIMFSFLFAMPLTFWMQRKKLTFEYAFIPYQTISYLTLKILFPFLEN